MVDNIVIEDVIMDAEVGKDVCIGKKPTRVDIVVLAQMVKNLLIDNGYAANVKVDNIEVDRFA